MQRKNNILFISLLPLLVILITVIHQKSFSNESYRIIQIEELEGNVLIERKGVGIIEAYPQMRLQSEDRVTVYSNSYAILLFDDEKYIRVGSNSEFEIEATDPSNYLYTNIKIIKGNISNELEKKK